MAARISSADCTRERKKEAADGAACASQTRLASRADYQLLNRQLLRRGRRLLGQRQFEHAVGILCAGPRFVDFLSEPEGPRDLSDVTLAVQQALSILRFLVEARFGGDRNFVAVDVHLDVFLFDAGKLSHDLVIAVVLRDVDLHASRRQFAGESGRPYEKPAKKIIDQIPERIVTRDICHDHSLRIVSGAAPVFPESWDAGRNFKGALAAPPG